MPAVAVEVATRLEALAVLPRLRSLECRVELAPGALEVDGRTVLVVTQEQRTLNAALSVLDRWCGSTSIKARV